MPKHAFEELMWARARAALDRVERLQSQFFHRGGASHSWEAPIDVFETPDALFILIALPGVDIKDVAVTLSAGVLVITGERRLPAELSQARIVRMEIPHGRFERRIELPPRPFEVRGRHLANGCLMLRLQKL
jgi:HSP20 family molecular chaperone IbpA